LEKEGSLVGSADPGFPAGDALGIGLGQAPGFDSRLVEIDQVNRAFNDDFGSFPKLVSNREPLIGFSVIDAVDRDRGFAELISGQGGSAENILGKVVIGVAVGVRKPIGEVGVGILTEVIFPPSDGGAFFIGLLDLEMVPDLSIGIEIGGTEGMVIDIDDHGAEDPDGGNVNRVWVGMGDGVAVLAG